MTLISFIQPAGSIWPGQARPAFFGPQSNCFKNQGVTPPSRSGQRSCRNKTFKRLLVISQILGFPLTRIFPGFPECQAQAAPNFWDIFSRLVLCLDSAKLQDLVKINGIPLLWCPVRLRYDCGLIFAPKERKSKPVPATAPPQCTSPHLRPLLFYLV